MKKCVFILLLTLFVLALCACAKSGVNIVEDERYYTDFYVEDDIVYINCTLTVEASKDQTISFVGNFSDDVEVGLLAEPTKKQTEIYLK